MDLHIKEDQSSVCEEYICDILFPELGALSDQQHSICMIVVVLLAAALLLSSSLGTLCVMKGRAIP